VAVTGLAFRDGRFLPFDDITIGIGTHAFNYGTSVFEGMRAYWNDASEQLLMFRPEEHFARLHCSARLFGMHLPHTVEELCDITSELLVRNGERQNTYIRPVLFKSSPGIGLWRDGLDDSFVIYQLPMGDYHAGTGIRCCVSSWRRAEGNAAPARAKVGGIYAAMALARYEAMSLGFDEAITLTANGRVAEGTAENIFLVFGDEVVTPDLGEDLLAGITRATIIELMRSDLGLRVTERSVNRSELYFADEVFMCGTAAEVTPVLEIDGRTIGDGGMGVTAKVVRDLYLDVVGGRREKYLPWCRPARVEGETA
jgi:branched-chain amino acid aminotransferase